MRLRLALALLLACAAGLQAKPDAEARTKAKIAKVWVEFARWCKLQDLKSEANGALARARALDPRAKDLDRLAREVGALAGAGEPGAAFEKRRRQAHRDAARLYDRLAGAVEAPRADLYRLDALGLDPSRARRGRLAAAAMKQPVLVRSPTHPLVGWMSLPRGWKPGREYPVLVAVDGAGSSFLGAARRFARARGSRRFVVLAPCTFANTNQLVAKKYPWYTQAQLDEWNGRRFEFDHDGLLRLLDFLREHFGAAEKFAITGFSGGGNLCYGMTLRHPERILFSVPACANFSGMGVRDAKPVEDGGPPIRILTGAKDPHREWTHGKVGGVPGIEPQTDRAVAVLKELGFTHWTRTMLDGVGHSNCVKQVWETADGAGRTEPE